MWYETAIEYIERRAIAIRSSFNELLGRLTPTVIDMNNTLFLSCTWELFVELRSSIAFISLSNLFKCSYFLARCLTGAVENWPHRPYRRSLAEARLSPRRETWRFLFSNLLPVTFLTVVTRTSYRLVWRMNELAQSLHREGLAVNVSEGEKLQSELPCHWTGTRYAVDRIHSLTFATVLNVTSFLTAWKRPLHSFEVCFIQQGISR